MALEVYVMVAENYAYGPLYNLAGGTLAQLGGKAFQLLSQSEKAKVAAIYLRGVLTKTQGLLSKLKARLAQLTPGSDKALELANKIDELEDAAGKLQAGIDDLEAVTLQAKKLGTDADEVITSLRAAENSVTRQQALQEFTQEAAQQNVAVIADDAAQEYLDYRAAQMGLRPEQLNALAVGDNILVRPGFAQNVRVLREELAHVYQQSAGASSAQVVRLEIEARLGLIRNRHRWTLTDDEVQMIIREVLQMQKTGKY